jgi:hypothetical protein
MPAFFALSRRRDIMRSSFLCTTLSLALLTALPNLTGSATQARPPVARSGYYPGYQPAYSSGYLPGFYGSSVAYPSYSVRFYNSGRSFFTSGYQPGIAYPSLSSPQSGYYSPYSDYQLQPYGPATRGYGAYYPTTPSYYPPSYLGSGYYVPRQSFHYRR